MDAIYDLVSQPSAERTMLVMLPGVRDRPQDLVEKGRDFTEKEKAGLRKLVQKTIGDIVPA